MLVVIIALLAVMLVMMPNVTKTDSTAQTTDNATSNPETPDTIKVELPEFETKYKKTVGEYTVEAQKWQGGSLGGFGVWLYKNGEQVDRDSYLSRAYFYKDGEWKWSEWGNGEGAAYHKYPLDNGIEIREVEVKF
ncbi:hypothetical protein [Methanobrevibacter sp.]|uniref:hypothetical protein n=1 Tax=Methanobrevibacter sp. TaxID=66852 RepID=UPI0026DFEA25|nr:hypothetical protein [Methanobrevibacter sp.]MDO5859873.1 hypothetical protein [Methanobrevibacter sp.]